MQPLSIKIEHTDLCLFLGYHSAKTANEIKRTPLGELVHIAKSYDQEMSKGNREICLKFAEAILHVIKTLPKDSYVIIPAPSSNSQKTFDLPTYLCQIMSQQNPLLINGASYIAKTRPTPQQKYQKGSVLDLLANNVIISPRIKNCDIIIIDDIIGSGNTISKIAHAAKKAGAAGVVAIALTKTYNDQI